MEFLVNLGQMGVVCGKCWVHVQIVMWRLKHYAQILFSNYSKEKTHCVATVGWFDT
jgi:hypothetical protein